MADKTPSSGHGDEIDLDTLSTVAGGRASSGRKGYEADWTSSPAAIEHVPAPVHAEPAADLKTLLTHPGELASRAIVVEPVAPPKHEEPGFGSKTAARMAVS